MATCTGFHPFGSMGERVLVSPEDNETTQSELSLIPARVGIIVAVKELVPYDEELFRSWSQGLLRGVGNESTGMGTMRADLDSSIVTLRDPNTQSVHKFLAIPVEQRDLVDVRHAATGASTV